MKQRAAALAGALLCCIGSVRAEAPAPAAPIDRFPGLAKAYAVRIDGELPWAHGLDTPRPPASLAKLLSALVILADPRWNPDEFITISPAAAAIEGSRVGLRAGERVRARDLLSGMLIRSGNDACLALVEHAAGSLAGFAELLARASERLGLAATRFVHACGLDAPGQWTTARDLLRLADVALAEPEIRERASVESAVIRTQAGREIRFRNSNALIGRSTWATGLKSGYTSRAGRCLIAVAERDQHRVVIVLLDAPDRWWEAASLVEQSLGYARLRAAAR